MNPVSRTVLPNGLTVLVRTDRSAPVVAIVTRVKAGYFDETDDVVGISHVLEHMYFKGTPTRGVGEIAKETKASGGYLNAHTIYDHTSYETVLPSSGFARGLEIQADAYANSLIDGGELARELEVIIQEAKRKLDSPGAVAMESMFALLHDRHRFRRWRIGEEAGLRTLTRDHLVAFYRNFYRPRNTVLAIVGDVHADTTLAEVERRYGHLPDEPVQRTLGDSETGPAGFRFRDRTGDIAMSQVAMGWRTVGPLHPDAPALDVAASLLSDGRGSRLYRGLRERRLATSASAMHYTPRDVGVFAVRLECDPGRAPAAAAAAWAGVGSLRSALVPAHELDRVKRLLEASWLRRQESMEGQADLLAEWEELGGWERAEAYLQRLLAVTPDEVREAAQRHLDPGQASVMLYRPPGAATLGDAPEPVRAYLDAEATAHAVADPMVVPSVAAAGPGEGATLEQRIGSVAVYRSTAGLPVLVRHRPGAPLVHLGVMFPGGSVDEPPHLAGVGTLMVRAALKGAGDLGADAMANATERLGGSIGAAFNADSGGWTLSVPTARWREALALLASVVQHPRLPDEAVETERSVALDQVVQLRDDMFRYPMRLAASAAFGDHAYGRNVLGSEETLRAISAGDVRDFHARAVLSSGAVVAAVGDIPEAELAAALAAAFSGIRVATRGQVVIPPWPAGVVVREEVREKKQTAFAIGFPAPARRDVRRHVVDLLSGIASGLGGRFFEELRDKRSLAYTVHAFHLARVEAGMFIAYIATEPSREAEARDTLLAEIARFRDDRVTAEELERAARYAVGSHAIARQGGAAMLGEMVDAWLLGSGLAEIDAYEGSINAVTRADVQAWAVEALDASRRVEGIVRAAT